ncbi:hypothetical protein SGM_0157 [Streptomyces griseoaurantiacus M045]|uniref:Uncharacterized protein n=1 Tax=Streptomyces griseoaurantiacus M045 TaxID=996637 RepID=F3N9X3_9ACTN|nr:hypothetical protein SGM_0157 [Streptomyces griseoaurantiacus M045]
MTRTGRCSAHRGLRPETDIVVLSGSASTLPLPSAPSTPRAPVGTWPRRRG